MSKMNSPESPKKSSEEFKNRGIWNYSYSANQQSQLGQAGQQRFTFTNPWSDDKTNLNDSTAYMGGNASTLSTLPENSEETLLMNDFNNIDQFKRRKSSIVIPPVRAPGPNPVLYGDYGPYYGQSYQQSDNYNGQPFLPSYKNSVMMQQQHSHQNALSANYNSEDHYVPLPPTSFNGYTNYQDISRRQSVGVLPFHQDYNGGPGSNNNNGAANGRNIPQLLAYRRLSAFPQTGNVSPVQPSYSMRRDDRRQSANLQSQPQQPLIIPQMQKCSSKADLKPVINPNPNYRRASSNSETISPLNSLTNGVITTYSLCSSYFAYKTSKNPKRVLTKPSEGKYNNGYDNVNSNYILYVNDVLGTEQGRKYLVLDMLGQGTFGQVVKCQNVATNEILAVKVVKSRSEYINQSVTEVKILKYLNQELDPSNKHHFLRLQDTFLHKNHLCLVFELLNKNLYELLKQNRFHGLSISLIRNFTTQLLDSLCVLKDNELVHCDLKPENILLCFNDKPDIKVIDFGSSCEESRTLYTYVQSRFYRAPEVILGMPYSASIDMWSLGCIVAELFLGIPIFPGASEFNQLSRIVNCLDYPPLWMIEMGKHSHKFFHKPNGGPMSMPVKLKTVEEFNLEYDKKEEPSKQYFKWEKLADIITNYRLSKYILGKETLLEQEKKDRICLIHFLKGILNINPLERWTPQQASMHPFITEQPFTGEWYPPGFIPPTNSSSVPISNLYDQSVPFKSGQIPESATARKFDGLSIK